MRKVGRWEGGKERVVVWGFSVRFRARPVDGAGGAPPPQITQTNKKKRCHTQWTIKSKELEDEDEDAGGGGGKEVEMRWKRRKNEMKNTCKK